MPRGGLRGAWPVERVPRRQAAVFRRGRRVPRFRRRCPAGHSQRLVRHRLHQCGTGEDRRVRRSPRERLVDTLLLARRKHPGVSNRLDDLCSRYAIDNSRRTKHGALLDAELLAEVYIDLIGARQSQLVLAERVHISIDMAADAPRRQSGGAAGGSPHRGRTRSAQRLYRNARRQIPVGRIRGRLSLNERLGVSSAVVAAASGSSGSDGTVRRNPPDRAAAAGSRHRAPRWQ